MTTSPSQTDRAEATRTAAPRAAAPSTAAPRAAAPSTAAPSTAAPSTAAPSTAAPSTAAPRTGGSARGRSLPLLVLGAAADPAAEKGVSCPGELPPPSDPDLVARARAARRALGDRAFILGHHYQRDEVIQFADVTGDSFKLAREAAARPGAEYVVFCGV